MMNGEIRKDGMLVSICLPAQTWIVLGTRLAAAEEVELREVGKILANAGLVAVRAAAGAQSKVVSLPTNLLN